MDFFLYFSIYGHFSNIMADDFDAPIAEEEKESWSEYFDVPEVQPKKSYRRPDDILNDNFMSSARIDDGLCTSLSGSLQDLVNSFDETINKCFQDYEQKTEVIAPVQSPTEEDIMKSSQ